MTSIFKNLLMLILVFVTWMTLGGHSEAAYQANNLIDDHIFLNSATMDTASIQSFLNGKGGGIRNFSENGKSAAQIIYEKAQAYGVNPQVILATLQKEQSLITDPDPDETQYRTAMGYGCPSSCDPAYYGFTNQVDNGTWQLRFNLERARGNNSYWNPSFSYACANATDKYSTGLFPGRNVTFYNPGGSARTFVIANAATAALYCYTPFVGPFSETGYSGSYNFVVSFEAWFGPTTGEGYVLAIADNGDPRQWVIQKGKRYWVPDPATKQAWGLPETPYTMASSYLGSFPDGPNLTRLMRPSDSLNLYFLVDGKKYKVPSTQMMDIWNLSLSSLIDVSAGLGALPTDAGDLTYVAQLSGNPAVYLIDSGLKRHIQDGNVLKAFAGDTPYVNVFTANNDTYFSGLGSGGDVGSPKISDGSGNIYILDSGRKLILDSVMNQLYPGAANSVTPAIYNYFGTQQMTYLIRAWNSPDVYLIDQGTRHHIIDPDVLDAWQSATYPSQVTVTSMGLRDFMSGGADITDYYASNGSNKYLIDKWQRPIDPSLQSAFTTGRNVYAASSALIGVFPASSGPTGLIRSSTSPAVYLLTNNGQLRWIMSPNRLALWAGSQTVTVLRPNNVSRYPFGGGISAFVTDGAGNNYLIEGGAKHPIDNIAKTNWSLGSPDSLDSGTVGRVSTGSTITNKLQGNGAYYLVHQGGGFVTVDRNIAGMWGIDDAPSLNPVLANEFLSIQTLTRIAHSRSDSRIFIEDHGVLYRLYPNTAGNLNAQGPYTYVDPSAFTVYDWTATVVKDEGSNNYVIDGGSKRPLPAGVIRDQWTYGNQANVPAMSNGFLNTLPTGSQIERAIKGSGPNIYAGENFTERWIQNPSTYASSYAPYADVSNSLLDSMPDGTPIP